MVYYSGIGGEIPVTVIEAQQREAEEAAEAIRVKVETAAAAAGIAIEWRCEQGDKISIAAAHARYSDLAVAAPDVARELVFVSAAPVISVPAQATAAAPRHPLVAWNGSREAARAVRVALPVLEAAEAVDIVVVDPSTEATGMDIARDLSRHGIKADVRERLSRGAEVGEILLEEARASGADLLVMGAYGHSRVREWILGGATASVLDQDKVPALLSH
jgi:nucleotide-binding universal stress UspA family protein